MTLYPGPTTLFQSKKLVGLTAACLLALLAAPLASAQTYSVVWYFTISGGSGAYPYAVTVDRFGNLYAPTRSGGFNNNQGCMLVGSCGTVWKFYNHGSGWVGDELYEFMDGTAGTGPIGPLTVAPTGILYDASYAEGAGGFFYQLRPPITRPPSAVYFWDETTLSSTLQPSPYLAFDASGNIYGTAGDIVFEASPSQGGWTFTTLYTFQGGDDRAAPTFGVLLDPAGNLYGATGQGGSANCGTVFELSNNGSGWTRQPCTSFKAEMTAASLRARSLAIPPETCTAPRTPRSAARARSTNSFFKMEDGRFRYSSRSPTAARPVRWRSITPETFMA